MRDYTPLIDALEQRAESLRKADLFDLNWVLLDYAVDAIRVLSGQHHLDRLMSNGTADRLEQTLDRLLFIRNVLDHDPDVSLKWIYTEIDLLLSGANNE